PASATMTKCSRLWRGLKPSKIGIDVLVSAWLPSKHPISKGNPSRSTNSPTTICRTTRRSFPGPHFTQGAVVLRLGIEGRRVRKTQAHSPTGAGLSEAGLSNLIAIPAFLRAGQGAEHRA